MKRKAKDYIWALFFLSPNLLLFLVFVAFPLVFSMVMAFTNWDLSLHNQFRQVPLQWIGLRNFSDLFGHPDFWKYLWNTVFFMFGIPVSIAGSLFLAVLLSRPLKVRSRAVRWPLFAMSIVFFTALGFYLWGCGYGLIAFIFCALAGIVLALGFTTGSVVYRTMFYLPHFCAGVAIFLLWKQMYNPMYGPINRLLEPVLAWLSGVVNSSPSILWQGAGYFIMGAAALGILYMAFITLRGWATGESESVTAVASLVSVLLFGAILVGIGYVAVILPDIAADGLQPPNWLNDIHWAKPALMIMSVWTAVGGNNMLLYIAGISNVPDQLYEAADIDGASRWQKFLHVTWPQLAPTTFFIVVMSVIGGLQGGFAQARAMTQGGPFGATTTIAYYIYQEGFETGRLGFASAVAWVMFLMIFVMTLINFKMGSKHVTE
jgi:multiple sugar transport system permease protein